MQSGGQLANGLRSRLLFKSRNAIRVSQVVVHVERPAIILIHGAANSSVVWTFWRLQLEALGWPTHAPDLPAASTSDYAEDVAAVAASLTPLPIVIGWDTGGLVAMQVAARGLARACIGLAPIKPSRVEIPSLRCPLLIVTGELDTEWPSERYADLHLPADHIGVKAATHRDLVLNPDAVARTAPAAADWLARNVGD